MNSHAGIRTNLLITTAVIITVGLALFMSQQDGRDGESLIANVVATVEMRVQGTPLSILLPTTTAAAPDAMATATITNTAGETSVALVPYCDNAPAHWLPYTVREGESIYSLSITSGATVTEIAQANCLEITQIITGLTIYLPPQPPVRVDCGPPNWWPPQMVYAGDTLYGLSVRHGTTVYAIMHANCLSSGYLVAGRTLYLPPLAVPPAPPTVPPLPTMVPTLIPTIIPSTTVTAVPTIIPTLFPTIIPTFIPTMTVTIPPTQPPITPTATLPPLPTATFTPLPTVVATETAVSTPTSTTVFTPTPPIAPTFTPVPPTVVPPTAVPPPTETAVP